MNDSTIGLLVRHLTVSEKAKRWRDCSDQELLAVYQTEQDEAAFTELMRRYEGLVLRTCRRVLGQGPDAEDAFQATFILLARKSPEPCGALSLGGWLHRVAYRSAMNVVKGAVRRKGHEQHTSIMATSQSSGPDPSAQATWNEVQPILDEELDAMPAQARRLLIACHLQEKTYAEIATELGLPPGSVGRHLQQARTLLATRLARRGITVSSVLLPILLGEAAKGAGVPAALRVHAVEAARKFTEQAAGVVSESVARLVKDGLAQMAGGWGRLGIVVLGLLGAGLIACQTLDALADQPPQSNPPMLGKPPSDEKEQARLDNHDDPLPPGALMRLGTTRLRNNSYGYTLKFTPDGKQLLTAGGNEQPRLWDSSTGKLMSEFRGIDIRSACTALSPDGKILAGRSGLKDNTLYLVDTTTGKKLHEFNDDWDASLARRQSLVDFAFSPDNKLIVGRFAGNLELRDVATGRTRWQKEQKDTIGLAFSPSGKVLASVQAAGGIRLWDARTGEQLRELGQNWPVKHLDFSPDGNSLIVGYETGKDRLHRSVYLWDVASGTEVRRLGEADKHVSAPVISPDGKTVATRGEGGIRLWDWATGKELRRCQQTHPHWPLTSDAVAFSPDGKVLAATEGPVVRFWDVASGKPLTSQLPTGHESSVDSVDFTPDGETLISAAGDHTLRWWDTRTGKEKQSLSCTKNFPLHWHYPKAVLSRDGKMLAVICADAPKSQDSVQQTVRTDGRSATRLLDASTGKQLHQLDSGSGCTYEVVLSPDSKTLAEVFCPKNGFNIDLNNPMRVRLWDTASGKRFEREFTGICPLFSLDGRILATLESQQISFWEMATGKKIRSVGNDEYLQAMTLAPDGKTLAASGSGGITLWSLSWDKQSDVQASVSRRVALAADDRNGATRALVFSPDGRMLASKNTRTSLIRVWETASGEERAHFQQDNVEDRSSYHGTLSFSPDGRRLAFGSADTTILIWDVTGRLQGGRELSWTLRPAKPSDKELENLWKDLEGRDAVRANRVIWTLVAAGPSATSFLKTKLHPVTPTVKPETVARFIADLDDDDFQVREKAQKELASLGEESESALRKALIKERSAESLRAVQGLLSQVEAAKRVPRGEVLRDLRAVEVLEQIGTSEALQVLEALADGKCWSRLGKSSTRLIEEARASRERMKKANGAR